MIGSIIIALDEALDQPFSFGFSESIHRCPTKRRFLFRAVLSPFFTGMRGYDSTGTKN